MKTLFLQYANYHAWAHARLFETIQSLSEEQQHREVTSSFPSLYKTVFHVWTAGTAWWQRLHEGQVMIKEDPFHGSFAQLADAIMTADQKWINWIKGIVETIIEEPVAYRTMKGEAFEQPMFQILLHLFNHSTYHNGQIVTIFHQLGVEKIPATDFILWARENR